MLRGSILFTAERYCSEYIARKPAGMYYTGRLDFLFLAHWHQVVQALNLVTRWHFMCEMQRIVFSSHGMTLEILLFHRKLLPRGWFTQRRFHKSAKRWEDYRDSVKMLYMFYLVKVIFIAYVLKIAFVSAESKLWDHGCIEGIWKKHRRGAAENTSERWVTEL